MLALVLVSSFFLACLSTDGKNGYNIQKTALTNWKISGRPNTYDTCFTPEQVEYYRSKYGISTKRVNINNKLTIGSEAWGFATTASALLLYEIFGYDIKIWNFYYDALKIVENSADFNMTFKMPYYNLAIEETNFGENNPNIDMYSYSNPKSEVDLLGVPTEFTFAMRTETLQDIHKEVNASTSNNLFADVWRAINSDEIKKHMNKSSDIDIDAFSCQSQWADGAVYDCFKGTYYPIDAAPLYDATYYPPWCHPKAGLDNDCIVLISWKASWSWKAHADLIHKYKLKMVVKYLGASWDGTAQTKFMELYNSKARVIFEVDTPSIYASLNWTRIAVPKETIFSDIKQYFKVIGTNNKDISTFSHTLMQRVVMRDSDFQWIYDNSYSNFGLNDQIDNRVNSTCNWLHSHPEKWDSWIDNSLLTTFDCNSLDDNTLEQLLHYKDMTPHERRSIVMKEGNAFFSQHFSISIHDQYTFEYAMEYCIPEISDSDYDSYYIMVMVFGVFGIFSMFCFMILIVVNRHNNIIIASSRFMLFVMLFGGLISMIYPFLSDESNIVMCYMRPFIIQIGLTIMAGAIMVKTWRINYYVTKAKQQKKPKAITDFMLLKKMATVLTVVILYLSILLSMFRYNVNEVILNGKRYHSCVADDIFKICYYALVAAQTAKLGLVAKDAWKLRNIGGAINESKWIGIILYHNVVLVGMTILIDIIDMEPGLKFTLTSIVVWLLVIIIAYVLLTPKFVNIAQGVQFAKAKLNFDELRNGNLIIQPNRVTRKDIHQIKKLLHSYGFEVKKNDNVQAEKEIVTGTSTSMFSKTMGSSTKINPGVMVSPNGYNDVEDEGMISKELNNEVNNDTKGENYQSDNNLLHYVYESQPVVSDENV